MGDSWLAWLCEMAWQSESWSDSIEMRKAAEVRGMEWLGTNECERLEMELGVWTIWTACNSQGLIQPESAT